MDEVAAELFVRPRIDDESVSLRQMSRRTAARDGRCRNETMAPQMGEIRQPKYKDLETGKTKTSAVWWIRYYRNGQRFSESSHTTKKSDAITLLKQREGAIANGEPITSKISRFKFAEAAADLLTEYRINNRRSTDEAARRIRKHLEPFFGGRRMTSINTADVRS